MKADTGESPSQFVVRLERMLDRWITASKIDQSFVDLCDMLTQEQFLRKSRPDLAAYLREKKEKTAAELAKGAELYLDAHGGTLYEVKVVKKRNVTFNSSKFEMNESVGSEKTCKYCKRSGHEMSECKKLRDKSSRKCFICENPSHLAAECPEKKKMVAACVDSESIRSKSFNLPLVPGQF